MFVKTTFSKNQDYWKAVSELARQLLITGEVNVDVVPEIASHYPDLKLIVEVPPCVSDRYADRSSWVLDTPE